MTDRKRPKRPAHAGREDEATTSAPEERGSGIELPDFGMAEDIVGRLRAPVSANDPERVFAFADDLDAAQVTAEAPTGPAPRFEPWITFGLADETYALPVAPVREVLRVSTITRVPHAPAPIRGVTQHRGRVIPVIDLRLRLGLPAAAVERQSRLLVVAARQRRLGLLIDQVFQVLQLDLNRAQSPPEDITNVRTDFITSVYHQHDDLLLMLDVERVLVVVGEESTS